MSITNTSKPTNSLTNLTRVFSAELWSTITTTWASETRTWAQRASTMSNLSRVSSSITNIAKP